MSDLNPELVRVVADMLPRPPSENPLLQQHRQAVAEVVVAALHEYAEGKRRPLAEGTLIEHHVNEGWNAAIDAIFGSER